MNTEIKNIIKSIGKENFKYLQKKFVVDIASPDNVTVTKFRRFIKNTEAKRRIKNTINHQYGGDWDFIFVECPKSNEFIMFITSTGFWFDLERDVKKQPHGYDLIEYIGDSDKGSLDWVWKKLKGKKLYWLSFTDERVQGVFKLGLHQSEKRIDIDNELKF